MSQRYQSIDALRGLIMVIMAIDHASAFIARQHASEFWAGAMSSYSDALPFLTRLVTHLCAPGFFFLLGAGVYWSGSAKRAAWRGAVIVLVGQLLEAPVMFLQSRLKPAAVSLNRISAPPPIDGTDLYWGFITLTGLGLVMMACALLLRLPRWTWCLTAALCVVATNSLLPADGKIGPLWQAVLLTPGLSQHVFVIYPVIPWLAAGAAGMCFGHWWKSNPDTAEKRVWIIGLVVLLAGVAIRANGGWGNIRLPRDSSWIEFLNNVKYPPSLVFLCLAIGANLILLALVARIPDKRPLVVFGQTPLFFYIGHFYLLFVIGYTLFPEAASLETMYVVWAVVIVALYPVCAWYGRFKLSKPPDSIWRMF